MSNILRATTGSFAKLKALSEAASKKPLAPMTGSAADRRVKPADIAPQPKIVIRERA